MKQRTIKQLLEILLDDINESLIGAMCYNLESIYYRGIINTEEYDLISVYINNNCELTVCSGGVYYLAKPGLTEPRIKWLKQHIKKNKK